MIKPTCDRCRQELTTFGGLAFSPPEVLPAGTPCKEVNKYHICVVCWEQFMKWVTPPAGQLNKHKLSYQLAAELLSGPNLRVVLPVAVFDSPGQMMAREPKVERLKVEDVDCVVLSVK